MLLILFYFFFNSVLGTVEVTNERQLRQQLCQHLGSETFRYLEII